MRMIALPINLTSFKLTGAAPINTANMGFLFVQNMNTINNTLGLLDSIRQGHYTE
jgi:hypothetical protein